MDLGDAVGERAICNPPGAGRAAEMGIRTTTGHVQGARHQLDRIFGSVRGYELEDLCHPAVVRLRTMRRRDVT